VLFFGYFLNLECSIVSHMSKRKLWGRKGKQNSLDGEEAKGNAEDGSTDLLECLKSENAQLQLQIEQLPSQDELDQLKAAYETLELVYNDKINTLQEQHNLKIQATIESHKSEKDSWQAQLQKLVSQLVEKQNEIEDLATANARRNSDHEQNVQRLSDKLKKKVKQVADLRQATEELSEKLKNSQQRVQTLTEEKKEVVATSKLLETEVRLGEQISRLKSEASEYSSIVQDLEQTVADYKEKLEQQKQRHESAVHDWELSLANVRQEHSNALDDLRIEHKKQIASKDEENVLWKQKTVQNTMNELFKEQEVKDSRMQKVLEQKDQQLIKMRDEMMAKVVDLGHLLKKERQACQDILRKWEEYRRENERTKSPDYEWSIRKSAPATMIRQSAPVAIIQSVPASLESSRQEKSVSTSKNDVQENELKTSSEQLPSSETLVVSDQDETDSKQEPVILSPQSSSRSSGKGMPPAPAVRAPQKSQITTWVNRPQGSLISRTVRDLEWSGKNLWSRLTKSKDTSARLQNHMQDPLPNGPKHRIMELLLHTFELEEKLIKAEKNAILINERSNIKMQQLTNDFTRERNRQQQEHLKVTKSYMIWQDALKKAQAEHGSVLLEMNALRGQLMQLELEINQMTRRIQVLEQETIQAAAVKQALVGETAWLKNQLLLSKNEIQKKEAMTVKLQEESEQLNLKLKEKVTALTTLQVKQNMEIEKGETGLLRSENMRLRMEKEQLSKQKADEIKILKRKKKVLAAEVKNLRARNEAFLAENNSRAGGGTEL